MTGEGWKIPLNDNKQILTWVRKMDPRLRGDDTNARDPSTPLVLRSGWQQKNKDGKKSIGTGPTGIITKTKTPDFHRKFFISQIYLFFKAAWAAASLAIGTRNGEQET